MIVEILKAIKEDTKRNGSQANIRLASACLLAFAGFLRFHELANIKVCDLSFSPHHLTIQIPCSKSDQLRQGSEVIITRTDAETCPGSMLEAYMKKGSNQRSSKRFLFRSIANVKSNKLRDSGNLTYSRMRDILKAKLEELGFPSHKFSIHSHRTGGATAAATAGIPDRDFQKWLHRRPNCEEVKGLSGLGSVGHMYPMKILYVLLV